MSNWQSTNLGSVLQVRYGKDHKSLSEGTYPCIGSGGVMRLVNTSLYEEESILIPRKGSLNNIMYMDKPFWTVDTMFWTKIDKSVANPKFLFYQLTQIDYENLNVGSAVPSLTVPVINDITVTLPSLKEQQAIAEVLSSLDDKINLLHRQNQTLEQMAETLFRKWFIDGAKEEWGVIKLKEVTDITIGRTPPRKEQHWFSTEQSDWKWISIKDMGNDGVFISKTSECLTDDAVKKFSIPIIPKDTVVLSFKMTVGRVAITTSEMLSNEAIAHFKLRPSTPFTKEFLFLFLKLFRYDSLGSTSSIVTAINSTMIKDMEITVPDDEVMNKFKLSAEPIFDKIRHNLEQVKTLEQQRDTLLPKLMSGEVRVKTT